MEDKAGPPGWLWRGVLLAIAASLAGGLALSAAIVAGWNNPRPARPPDWESSGPSVLEVARPDERTVVLLGRPVGPFALETVATPVDGSGFNGYGLAFRARGPDHYAVFAVGADGYVAVLEVLGETEAPLLDWQPFPHVRRGRAGNRLRVACADGVCRFWVNDEYLASLPDDLGPAGDVGVWLRRFEGEQVRVEFLRVAVWDDYP